ncbi:MAG: TonB family protein [Bacteroidales bacterium]|nr:TonB family protein [Bacteroidales bacterium]
MSKIPKRDLKEEQRAKVIGASMAIGLHLLALTLFFNTGFRVIYPPPAEMGIEVELEMEPVKPIQVSSGNEPRVERPNPEEEVRLVQRSQSPIAGTGANRGAEATAGDKGDVEQYEPPKPKPVDRRALFPSASNADSTAPQVARERSREMTAGHSDGNTRIGSTEGEPQARLAGRSIMGSLPEPEYNVNKSGKVVVRISVDQYGTVISATAGVTGTTVQDKTLWEAAKRAALKAKFNISSAAPAAQEGTITYIFKLK